MQRGSVEGGWVKEENRERRRKRQEKEVDAVELYRNVEEQGETIKKKKTKCWEHQVLPPC